MLNYGIINNVQQIRANDFIRHINGRVRFLDGLRSLLKHIGYEEYDHLIELNNKLYHLRNPSLNDQIKCFKEFILDKMCEDEGCRLQGI